jgi:hypothetical protein
MSVIGEIDREIAALEQDVQQKPDPRLARLKHLREVREHYLKGTQATNPAPTNELAMFAEGIATLGRSMVRQAGRKPSPVRVKAVAALKMYLRDKKEPVKTGVLYDYLVSQNISLGGDNPANNLSALLHNTPGFQSHKRSGWTLEMQEATH